MELYYRSVIIMILALSVVSLVRGGALKGFFPALGRDLSGKGRAVLPVLALICLAAVFFLDRPVTLFFRSLSSPFFGALMHGANEMGNGYYLYPFLLLLYLFSVLFSLPRLRRISGVMILGVLLAGLAGEILKSIFLRSRPYLENGPLHFFNYHTAFRTGKFFSGGFKSFPSGHTINAFAFMTAVFLSFRKKTGAYLIFILPALTGAARIVFYKHWLSDVLLGACVAVYFTGLVFRLSGNRPDTTL